MSRESSPLQIPSLDGWRTVAIALVFFSHAGLHDLVPGGFGVTVFFFLSGYLITTLMILEKEKTGRISIPKFYLRRFFRLFPPLIFVLVAANALCAFGFIGGRATLQGFLAQLLYMANYLIVYFPAGELAPMGTGVFWSLSIEEHFYIVFPWLVWGVRRASRVGYVLLATCLILLLWRLVLVNLFHAQQVRTYYATDTRFDSIAYGCLLAIFKNPLKEKNRNQIGVEGYVILGVSVSALMASFLIRNAVFRETFRYSMQGIALLPVFYYSILFPRNWLFKILNLGPVRYLGEISYSFYLVHHIVLGKIGREDHPTALQVAMSGVCALILAMAMHVLIEKPAKRLRERISDALLPSSRESS